MSSVEPHYGLVVRFGGAYGGGVQLMEGSAVRAILMVLGSWVVISVPVSLLVGSVLKRLDTEARRQAPLAKVLELPSTRLYGRSAPVRRLSA
jgi:hypothetical protein